MSGPRVSPDIIERLRVWPAGYGEDTLSSTIVGSLMKDAADEIGRLRHDNAALTLQVSNAAKEVNRLHGAAQGPLRQALEAAREEIVLTIAFLGRDVGTERLSGTIQGLTTRLVEADKTILAAFSAPSSGPLSGTFDAIYDALGDVDVDDSGKCRWSDIANIQRAVYQMARDSGTSASSTHSNTVAEPSRCKNPVARGESKETDASTGDAPVASVSTPSRCEICDWPLAESWEKGCVPGNCSYRPDDPAEQRRIRERRQLVTSKLRGGE